MTLRKYATLERTLGGEIFLLVGSAGLGDPSPDHLVPVCFPWASPVVVLGDLGMDWPTDQKAARFAPRLPAARGILPPTCTRNPPGRGLTIARTTYTFSTIPVNRGRNPPSDHAAAQHDGIPRLSPSNSQKGASGLDSRLPDHLAVERFKTTIQRKPSYGQHESG